ncbi:MAG: hypothetical protein EZS28_044646 [Streblomastix strix]|uniref:Tc1-like transposase DDE domain-containing protein n=1 Tax=Streblomastix strix TaxID=222440 RepID=A0A5J4TNN4_9EUKA|nr:MAG: hypothetical protein EZS28_044646 [Streblomastix strix]
MIFLRFIRNIAAYGRIRKFANARFSDVVRPCRFAPNLPTVDNKKERCPKKDIDYQKIAIASTLMEKDKNSDDSIFGNDDNETPSTEIQDPKKQVQPMNDGINKENEALDKKDQVYIHFDNATSHNAKLTTQHLDDNEIIRIAHPAYSPDLSPLDYFLFDYMKEKLKGNSFKTAEEAVDAGTKILYEIPRKMLKSSFDNWSTRALYVNTNGGKYNK